MQPNELLKRISEKQAPVILDVRSGFEYARGHIQGAIHAPTLKILFGRVNIPGNKRDELVVTCEHGPRAMFARSVLAQRGYTDITLLDGHMAAWRKDRLPIVKL